MSDTRHRFDYRRRPLLGDIERFARSIDQLGLLRPIVVRRTTH
jgi:ParB-like chromosome segregation protein Spo0J